MTDIVTEPAGAEPTATGIDDDATSDDAIVEEELLIEEISIDGMCGVY